MKHSITILAFAVILGLFSSSFTVNKSVTFSNDKIKTSLSVVSGDYVVGYFYDSKSDQTQSVTGYSFTFESDGSIYIVHGGAVAYPGQYTSDNNIMSLNFVQSELSAMNGTYTIVSNDVNGVKLVDGDKQLIFVPNTNPHPADNQ